MKFKLHAGSTVDTLTQDELHAGLTQNTASWFQERARGIYSPRFDTMATVATATITLPPTGGRQIGPQVGYAWDVRRITADGLAAADVLIIYRNSVVPANRIGRITDAAPWSGSKDLIMRGDEHLVITGASLTATGDITINGEAIEVAETDLWKLL